MHQNQLTVFTDEIMNILAFTFSVVLGVALHVNTMHSFFLRIEEKSVLFLLIFTFV